MKMTRGVDGKLRGPKRESAIVARVAELKERETLGDILRRVRARVADAQAIADQETAR